MVIHGIDITASAKVPATMRKILQYFHLTVPAKLLGKTSSTKTSTTTKLMHLLVTHLLNTGDQLHFLFNQQEKRLQLLSPKVYLHQDKMTRNPTLKNLDQGYDFMARYGKQVGSRQIIFPCMYRNYLCFARLEL